MNFEHFWKVIPFWDAFYVLYKHVMDEWPECSYVHGIVVLYVYCTLLIVFINNWNNVHENQYVHNIF
jgi:hypothetical protein